MDAHELEEHDFTLDVDHPMPDHEIDALFEAGCDDMTPEVGPSRTLLHVHRRDASLVEAIVSSVLDVERAGLVVAGVGSNDLVDLPEIAARVGRTRESIRLLAAGRRGPGDFPAARDGLYSWTQVRGWFTNYAPETVGSPSREDLDYDRVVAAADHLVRARILMRRHVGGLEALVPG